MTIVPKLIAAAAVAVFLLACVYVGYINEQLKVAISPANRAIVLVGFILGAGAVSRYMTGLGVKRLNRRKARP